MIQTNKKRPIVVVRPEIRKNVNTREVNTIIEEESTETKNTQQSHENEVKNGVNLRRSVFPKNT